MWISNSQFASGVKGVVLNLEQDNVGVAVLGLSQEIQEGDSVICIDDLSTGLEVNLPKKRNIHVR